MAPILSSFGATSILKVLAASRAVFPTYTFTSVPASINEGASGSFSISTTRVGNGTTLYWTINNISSADSDFVATSGSFTVTDSSGSFNVIVANDTSTEGTEAFTVSIRENSTNGPVVATSQSVNIGDRVYTFVTAPTSINEGVATTYVISTTNVAQGNTLYWTINHISTAAADFSTTSGSFNVAANANGSFVITTVADVLQEGSETFTIYIRLGSTSGVIVSESATITINDTSLPAAPSTVEYLIVGAGGGGGNWTTAQNTGGGGGGGGYRTSPSLSVSASVPYTVAIGGGAPAQTNGSNSGIWASSPFPAVWSDGGGAGGGPGTPGNGFGGGSGGGGSGRGTGAGPKPGGAGTAPQGNSGGSGSNGGFRGGGGGGSSAIGGAGAPSPGAGNGGAGIFSSISGANTGYSGGGGGGGAPGGLGGSGVGGRGGFPPGPTQATAGLTNQGGGGGGADQGGGGNGGSGVVIIRYAPQGLRDATTTGSPDYSNTAGYKTYRFTGAGTISW